MQRLKPMQRARRAPGCPPGGRVRAWLQAALWASVIVLLLVAGPGRAAPAAPLILRQAELIGSAGQASPVALPFRLTAPAGDATVEGPLRVRLRLVADLGPTPHRLALYLPGLVAHARISVNGHVLDDRLGAAGDPLPRSIGRIRWLRVPDAALQSGRNVLEIDALGQRALSVSPVWLGPTGSIERAFDDRVLATVIGPGLVATIIVCLAVCVLVLWARRRHETVYAYFGVGALGWGLHSGWSVLPVPLLRGVHEAVWWTSLYAFFVAMLVIFCTRFAGWRWRAFERIAWALAVLAPPALYAAHGLGRAGEVDEAWRAACIAVVGVALGGVALHAWRHRDATSALLLASGALGFALGARDWWVAHAGRDNNPVYLTPYAGLPFIALAAWMLIDGFVRARRELEDVNATLEARVARGSAELRQALEAMRLARDAAETAVQARSRFLAAASHDLRQPIHALGLYLGSIGTEGLPAPLLSTLQRMGGSLASLQTLLEGLFDLSRMDAGVVVPEDRAFDLEALLRRLGDEFAPLAERKGLRLVVRGASRGQGWQARGDPLLVERVLRNLLANAVQYTEQGGVLLGWRPRQRVDHAWQWQVDVRDTGCGIADADQERVFEEFYRAPGGPSRQHPGLGLGLSIVRRLVDLMGLELRVRSRVGRGTQMSLGLPVAPASSPALLERPAEPLPAGRWVCVVEDDPGVRDSMRALLTAWRCRLIEGATGDEALAGWRAAGRPRVQAIIADFSLPGGSTGLAAIAQLRSAFDGATVPALVVSGDATPERLRALTDSPLPWMSKPVPIEPLRGWLSTALSAPPAGREELACAS